MSSITDQSLTQIEYIHECDRIPTWVGRGIDDCNYIIIVELVVELLVKHYFGKSSPTS
jgi:hypothetical protein